MIVVLLIWTECRLFSGMVSLNFREGSYQLVLGGMCYTEHPIEFRELISGEHVLLRCVFLCELKPKFLANGEDAST